MKPVIAWAIACPDDDGKLFLVGMDMKNPELYATRTIARKEIAEWDENKHYKFRARPVKVCINAV